MRVNFLGASDDTPLSKTYQEIAPGTFAEESYPNVSKFNSIYRDVTTLREFYEFIVACAKEKMCLVKGVLDQALLNESRAGHTDPSAPTQWLCLDVDYTVTEQTPGEWLDALSPEFEGVSYIFQRSASMGIKCHEGWRGHFFVLLESPQPPQVLKQWLIQRNLVCASLQTHIGLSASGGALTYPLDVTTCQNDKLIYIAPPKCIGFTDPIEARFMLHERDHERVNLDLSTSYAATNQKAVKEMIAKLRKASGFEKKTLRTTRQGDVEILTNPDPMTVTGEKEARGFVYLNLNGGDSWAYYFPVDNPELLYNFKGEPAMYMRDVDQDILAKYKPTTEMSASVSGAEPFGFLNPVDDTYYRGFANRETQELEWLLPVGSKAKLKDFYTQHGVQLPKPWAVDEWHMEFDPTNEGAADFARQHVNTYKRTDYILNARTTDSAHIPPTIDHVLSSVCVDAETKAHFLNWLASIFQTRSKTNTAWIFQGVQGTGKGVLFTRILAPIIGKAYCHEMTMDRLDDDYNAYLTNNILLFIDEAKITDSKNGDRLLNRIKNLVTEPEQHIRGMRRNAVGLPNYSNIILASNYDEIIPMEVSDRRFNVAPRQEKSLQLDYDDLVRIEGELPEFSNFLHSYKVDNQAVKKVLLSAARDQLIKLSETTVDAFFHAFNTGNLSYFTQYLDNSVKADLEGIRYHDYKLVVGRWIESAGTESNVSRTEMRTCYQFLQGNSISATKFSRMAAKYGHEMVPVRIDGQVTRGIRGVLWEISDEEREYHHEEKTSKVVQLKDRK